ncbi:MAG: hypothetical protein IJ055_06355 [Oscillospiraceae bacterium]|nr:hypothetical protein [Oscillospiraceae bacterium]
MKKHRMFAVTAAVLCAVSAMPLSAGAVTKEEYTKYAGDVVREAIREKSGYADSYDDYRMEYIVYRVTEQEIGFYTLVSSVLKDGTVEIFADPVTAVPAMLTEHVISGSEEIAVGDVIVLNMGYSQLDTFPGTLMFASVTDPDIQPQVEPEVINLGSYKQYLPAVEATMTSRTDPYETGWDTNFTFVSEDNEVLNFQFRQYQNEYVDVMTDMEPGGTLEGFTVYDCFIPMSVTAAAPLPEGDPDEDGAVNAKDASAVLMTAAQIGAKQKPGLNLAQRNACDVNKDGAVNAKDASCILRYAAYIGAKNPYKSISDFLS